MSEVITLFCPVNAKPGCGEKMKKALIELASVTIREPGNICYRPHATKDPDKFLIFEQWKNADAHAAREHGDAEDVQVLSDAFDRARHGENASPGKIQRLYDDRRFHFFLLKIRRIIYPARGMFSNAFRPG